MIKIVESVYDCLDEIEVGGDIYYLTPKQKRALYMLIRAIRISNLKSEEEWYKFIRQNCGIKDIEADDVIECYYALKKNGKEILNQVIKA